MFGCPRIPLTLQVVFSLEESEVRISSCAGVRQETRNDTRATCILLIALKLDILIPPSRTNFTPRSNETTSVHQCTTFDVLRAQQPIFHRRPSQIDISRDSLPIESVRVTTSCQAGRIMRSCYSLNNRDPLRSTHLKQNSLFAL